MRKRKREAGLTQAEAAELLGISARMLRKHTADGRISTLPDGRYDRARVEEEYGRLKAEASAARSAGFGGDEYQRERARLTREKADQAERENRIRRGELVELDDVEVLLRRALERANAVLKNAPSKYGTKLARRSKLRLPEAKALLSEIVESVRGELRASPGGSDAAAA